MKDMKIYEAKFTVININSGKEYEKSCIMIANNLERVYELLQFFFEENLYDEEYITNLKIDSYIISEDGGIITIA